MTIRQDKSKPIGTNDKSWHRLQITKFVEANPQCKPKDVFAWVSSHDPNPWPSCDRNIIGKIMRRIRNPRKGGLSISHNILSFTFQTPEHKWNTKKPDEVDGKKWRRIQLTLYLDQFPTHKPRNVLKQLKNHTPNPWPECTRHKLSQQLVAIKQ